MEGYNNEGFLYINHTSTETFKKGEILDSDGNRICLGEIEPYIASPLDENYQDYMRELIYWTPLLRGIRIRIYWYAEAGEFNISTAGKIYPKNSILFMHPLKINEQINFDELDQSMCYYAIIERTTKKIILTHIVKNSKEDKNNFTQQLTWKSNEMAKITTILNKEDGNQELLKEVVYTWKF
jgi:hypothetical protein